MLFISSGSPPGSPQAGGVWTYILCVAPALVLRGHEVHVLVCADKQSPADYDLQGVHIHCRGMMRIPGFRRLQRFLLPGTLMRLRFGMTTLSEYRRLGVDFDVVEYPDWNAAGVGIGTVRPVATVAQLHGIPDIWEHHGKAPTLDVRWAAFLERLALNRAHVVVASSHAHARAHRDIGWFTHRDVEVLPLPIDWINWRDVPPADQTKPIVLFLGRVARWKAPEILVQAMAIVRRAIPDAEARFIGHVGRREGIPYPEWMARNGCDLTGCSFLGHVPRDQVRAALSAARVLALPSRFESFGLVAAEAMSAARPVVVTAATGISELLRETGGGVVVPPGDPAAFAEALLPFLRNPEHAVAVGGAGRAAVRDRLAPERIAARREIIYEQAVGSFGQKRRLRAAVRQ
ncbi:MAG TPA: glycosyltransferase family 4 protein [bacterium]